MSESLFADPTRKAVVFSEWTTMLDLIEPIFKRLGLNFVQLDGKVPQRVRREKVAAAGGQLLGALFEFVGELVGQDGVEPPKPVVESVKQGLQQCVERDEQGRTKLVLTLPNQQNIDQLAKTLAKLLLPGNDGQS